MNATMSDEQNPPLEVLDLVSLAQNNVQTVIGIAPDFTTDTLPLVDEYLRRAPRQMSKAVEELLISSVGSYFGEVIRRKLDGRWVTEHLPPAQWRIELRPCFLYFFPVGMAGEVRQGEVSAKRNGSFSTMARLRDRLESLLAAAPPVPEDEYFSLTGRSEILETVADYLIGLKTEAQEVDYQYSPRDYLAEIKGPSDPSLIA
jgi:hypothetical protein